MSSAESAYQNAVIRYQRAVSHVETAQGLLKFGVVPSSTPAELQKLAAKAEEQRRQLVDLAARLRVAPPWFTITQHGQSVSADSQDVLARADAEVASADEDIRAVRRELTAPLLPDVAPAVRAGLVYTGWCLLGWLMQCGLLVATNGVSPSAFVTALCGTPILAFVLSWVTMSLFGQPRIGAKQSSYWKLGLAICLLGMPAAWIIMVATLSLFRR